MPPSTMAVMANTAASTMRCCDRMAATERSQPAWARGGLSATAAALWSTAPGSVAVRVLAASTRPPTPTAAHAPRHPGGGARVHGHVDHPGRHHAQDEGDDEGGAARHSGGGEQDHSPSDQ